MVGNPSHHSILMATTTITATPKTNHVNTVLLYGVPIVSLYIDGMERLCLAQISNTLLKQYSYNEIHNRRVALGITCVQCTPVQLELLRRAGAMPVSSRRCGMITRREAERLCRSFLGDNSPPRLPDDFSFTVQHKCAWGCRGAFLPSRYNSSRAKCIKCCYCGLFYSPNKFIFHSHRLSVSAKYTQPDAANFNSWRRHMFLCGDPPEDIMHAWEDVKAMFNGGTRKRCISATRVQASDCCKKIRDNADMEIMTTLIPTTTTTTTTTATTTIATTSNSTHNTQFMLDYFWQQQHSSQSITTPTTPTNNPTTTHFPWLKLKSEFSTHFRLPTSAPTLLSTTHANTSTTTTTTTTTKTATTTNLCSLVALSAATSSAFKPVNNRKQPKTPKMEYADDIDNDDGEDDLKGRENFAISEEEEEELVADETEDEEIVVDIETMEEDEEQPLYHNKLVRKQIVNNNNNNNNKNIEIEINVDVNVVDDDDDADVEVGFQMNVDDTNDSKRKQIKSNKPNANANSIIKTTTTTTAESMLLLSTTGATTNPHRQQLPHYNDNNNISMFAANCFLKKQFDKQHKIYSANDDLQQLQQQQHFLANSTSLKSEQFMMSNLMDATKLRLRLNLTKDNYNFYQQQQPQQHINNENDDQRATPQHSNLFSSICNSNNNNNNISNNNNIVAVDLLNYQNPH